MDPSIVIGLGNPLRGDDAVGLHVVRRLRPLLADWPEISVEECQRGGLRLMERLEGYRIAFLIDALVSGARPGSLAWLPIDGLPTHNSTSSHDVNLPTALAIGRLAGAHLPADDQMHILGIEIQQCDEFGESLSHRVAEAIDPAVQAALANIHWLTRPGSPQLPRLHSAACRYPAR